MPEAQCRIGGDPALAVNDPRNPVDRHVDLARKLRGTDAELAQFLRKMFARMNGGTCHDDITSVIIDNLYVNRAW